MACKRSAVTDAALGWPPRLPRFPASSGFVMSVVRTAVGWHARVFDAVEHVDYRMGACSEGAGVSAGPDGRAPTPWEGERRTLSAMATWPTTAYELTRLQHPVCQADVRHLQ
jgi:hypothetical protein